jgi:fucose permease
MLQKKKSLFFSKFSMYFCFQSSFGDYIYSFAEKSIKGLRKDEGAQLNACFWVFID